VPQATFQRWSSNQTGGLGSLTVDHTVPLNFGMTLYAVWAADVDFNPNNGHFISTGSSAPYRVPIIMGNPVGAVITTPGLMPHPGNLGRNGWHFAGWFDQRHGGTQFTSTGPAVEHNIVLEAQWDARITFDLNGGEISGDSTNPTRYVREGNALGAFYVPPTPTHPGYPAYIFSRWVGPGTATFNPAAVVPATGSFTVTAEWTPRQTVTFDANGGNWPTGTTTPVTRIINRSGNYGQAIQATTDNLLNPGLNRPTRDGWAWQGWWTAPTGGTRVQNTTAVNTLATRTLYARWTENPLDWQTITFDANGGNWPSGTATPVTRTVLRQIGGAPATYAQALAFNAQDNLLDPALNRPTRDGYNWEGWFPATTGGTRVLSSHNVSTDLTRTLYARWSRIPGEWQTITFDANGGNWVAGTQTPVTRDVWRGNNGTYARAFNDQDHLVNPDLNRPTRDDHSFVGWYTAPTGGTRVLYTADISAGATRTLHARWSLDATITFHFRDVNRVDHTQVVPVVFGQPVDPVAIASIMNQAGLNYGADLQGYAFWGWFSDQELAASARTLPITSTSIGAGLRRPVVGTNGFCYRYNFVISEALFNSYRQGNTINLYAIWSLWGDVNDDDQVTFEDATLIQFYVALFPNINLVRPAGDVTRTGSLDFDDATLIQLYVALFPNIFLGRPQTP